MNDTIFDILNPDGTAPYALLADHAGKALPDSVPLHLRLPESEMARHIAYDIGTRGLTEYLAQRTGAPAIIARYSRLLTDLNRAPDDPDCIRTIYDGTEIPFNADLSPDDKAWRLKTYFHPYHDAVDDLLLQHPNAAAVFIHSFTPRLREAGQDRPWEIAVLWKEDPDTAQRAMAWLRRNTPYHVGDNEPYSLFKHSAYTLDRHVYPTNRRHLLLEIRQDLIADEAGQHRMAQMLKALLSDLF